MAKFIRYALAAICFALSVGSVALWRASLAGSDYIAGPYKTVDYWLEAESARGTLRITAKPLMSIYHISPGGIRPTRPLLQAREIWRVAAFEQAISESGRFGVGSRSCHFPIWYAALVCALAGVGVLRVRRQFSMRAALITVSVVAARLGMVVAL